MRTLVALCCICTLFAGASCESEPDTAAPEPAPATTATQAPSGPQDIVGDGTPLDPGIYTFSPFEPAVTFELGDGWEGGHTNPEFFDVWRGMRIAVMFGRPSFVFDAGGERVPVQELTATSALELLRDRGSESGRAPSVVLDGGSVPSIFITTERSTELFGGPEGTFSTDPSHRLRVAAVDGGGTLVLVMVSAATPIELEDRLAVTEMLGTIDFEG